MPEDLVNPEERLDERLQRHDREHDWRDISQQSEKSFIDIHFQRPQRSHKAILQQTILSKNNDRLFLARLHQVFAA